MEEFKDVRLKSGIKKVEQLRASGASVLACPCENCRLQIEELNEVHGLGLEIWQVIDLVVAAMPLPGSQRSVEAAPAGEGANA
jgi:Fe-S oxidoreductase